MKQDATSAERVEAVVAYPHFKCVQILNSLDQPPHQSLMPVFDPLLFIPTCSSMNPPPLIVLPCSNPGRS